MRAVYLTRRDAMIAAIQNHASDVLTVGNSDAGLHLVALLPDGTDDKAVVRAAAEASMYPTALSTCYANGAPRPGLVLGFGGFDERALTDAIRRLAGVIRDSI
jgi:GntR family transcriptional regulator/MocR family aminotransferase